MKYHPYLPWCSETKNATFALLLDFPSLTEADFGAPIQTSQASEIFDLKTPLESFFYRKQRSHCNAAFTVFMSLLTIGVLKLPGGQYH
jgi:hypothetical protein